MNIDKFGHHVNKKRKTTMIKECCLRYVNENTLDARDKTIKNIGSPIDLNDSVSKNYVDTIEKNTLKKITELNQIVTQLTHQLSDIKKQIANLKQFENEQRKRGK